MNKKQKQKENNCSNFLKLLFILDCWVNQFSLKKSPGKKGG